MTLRIAGRPLSRDGLPFIIAEIGVNHDGDMAVARQLIDAAAEAGADAVKFQSFRAQLLLAREAELVEYQKTSASSAEDLLEPLELSAEQLAELIAYAHRRHLAAIVTPFSPVLAAEAAAAGTDALKLASPDVVNRPLLDAALATGLPLILSTGAATLDEIVQAVDWLGAARGRAALLHCVSSYPTSDEHATLAGIGVLRGAAPDVIVGYSDHTTRTLTGALGVSAGASILEKHLTLDRTRRGPDHAASLEPDDFAEYVRLARLAGQMRGRPEKRVLDIETPVRQQTRQSLAVSCDLPAGAVLTQTNLTVMRPGTGIPAAEYACYLGRRTRRALMARTLLRVEDVEECEKNRRA